MTTNQNRKNWILAGAVAVLSLGLTAKASPSLLINFVPEPTTSAKLEISIGNSIQTLSGAWGNGDGEAYVESNHAAQMTDGGLTIATDADRNIAINTIDGNAVSNYGGEVNNAGAGRSYTTFYDTTLTFTGLNTSGDEVFTVIQGLDLGVHTQYFSAGTFKITSTVGEKGSVVLLEGTISGLRLFGISGASTGSILSSADAITYTGGVLLPYWNQTGGTNSGEMSISLLDVKPVFSNVDADGPVKPFVADATGLFNAVPEPSTLALLSISGLALLSRKRSK